MRAFEVYLNGKKLCLAGIGDDGVLTTIVNWVARGGKGDLFLEVGGLITPVSEHVAWVKQKPLRVGDQLRIMLVERNAVDPPTEVKTPVNVNLLELAKNDVRHVAL